ncbi:MAG: two-component system, OmpR family, response regulator [Chthoniobacter sp.]|jgi:putative two-component system response regulator|nr:two-component system, OmpR family, response regulator [Chthoniobacter sp.]
MNKKRILVIDDEPGFTNLMVKALTEYEVCVENDSTQALATALRFKPDLVLLDMVMPVVDGGEVTAQFLANPALAKVPIVFLTAIFTKEDAASGRRIKGYPLLAKPTTATALRAVIEEKLAAGGS